MYLKEIKVSGFKSFADNINIDLENNIAEFDAVEDFVIEEEESSDAKG